MNNPLWQPSSAWVASARVTAFIKAIEKKRNLQVYDFKSLYQWSLEDPAAFWEEVWEFCDIKAETQGQRTFVPHADMKKALFFPEARLNYAENLLQRRDATPAIYALDETGQIRTLTFAELYNQVAALVQVLRSWGITAGDRVAGFVPNIPETVVAMLATTALGAVWCSCSPDFGSSGVLDRFGQIEPKVLFATDGYMYGGKVFPTLTRVAEIVEQLPTVQKTVVIQNLDKAPDIREVRGGVLFSDLINLDIPADISFTQVPFHHPLFIMFSSGTTGKPKCIVHGVGGTLLQHLKEHQLHCDVRPGDRVFYFTTCGWMMWNWQVSALASGAALVLYDGSPMSPHASVLLEYAEKVGVTLFGVAAKYIASLEKAGVSLKGEQRLKAVRMITSTGSPLAPESFDYVYTHLKSDVCLASISGGTDILSCFVLGASVLPVRRGEIQTCGLGMDVAVFDPEGNPVLEQKGELVCRSPFPSMPIGFWNDAESQKYHEAYFARFPGVWCHGDLTELKKHGGVVIYGRSDTVLNPGGVRIGTGEIYRQVEQIVEVLESIAVGQEWDHDVRIVLFVKLKEGVFLDEALVSKIKTQIRSHTTPRHVPSKVIAVPDIPRTKSGKIVELAVKNIVHGLPVNNV